jgi:hypothetical protein
MSGNNDAIVLLDPEAATGRFENLIRLSANGAVAWRAALPGSGDDAYVDVHWEGAELLANSFSCFRVQVDVDSGRIVKRMFTK